MKIALFSIILNQHQAAVADELWVQTNHQFAFVELEHIGDTKGGTEDYSTRPYLLQAWKSQDARRKAFEWAISADVCIFSGAQSLPFQRERMKRELLSFEMSERWLKRGWKNLLSPNLLKIYGIIISDIGAGNRFINYVAVLFVPMINMHCIHLRIGVISGAILQKLIVF